jgi:hypothetical protein
MWKAGQQLLSSAILAELIRIYERDLSRLETKIDGFQEGSNLWKTARKIQKVRRKPILI